MKIPPGKMPNETSIVNRRAILTAGDAAMALFPSHLIVKSDDFPNKT
jgi:hypothetical protein